MPRPYKLITFFLVSFILLSQNVVHKSTASTNPFTPKASLIRYWNSRIYKVPKPEFLLSKASPLTPVELASFSKLADENSISVHLGDFCKFARLFCFPDMSSSLEKHDSDVSFSSYSDKNFTNYGTNRAGGLDSFKNYSNGDNLPVDDFRRYSRDATGHDDKFTTYASDGNVISQSFNTYGAGTTGGAGDFSNYAKNVNVPDLKFTSYSDEGNGRDQSFGSYSDGTNSGNQAFANYGKAGNGETSSFTSYGKDSNVIGSGFQSYSQAGNGNNDSFSSYGFNGNVPENNFKSYGDGGNDVVEGFTNYRDESNVGDDKFTSYGKKSNAADVNFANYGKSFNEGSDTFSGYGERSKTHKIGFKGYGVNNTFKDYAKDGVTFSDYRNTSSSSSSNGQLEASLASKKGVNKWVEPGKFFREKMLKTGTVMPMPDIKDKMPQRSFLPRSLLSKLPFSSAKIAEMKQTFHAFDNSSMESILKSALKECERTPSPGETKKCVGSAEDMIDFAVSVLGNSVELRTTENINGSKSDVLIGRVRGINGSRVTKSVSCHQSLYPYLLYYCHSVPKVRVYEADLLDAKNKKKINHGVAICHLDTSAWSSTHGAFLALGRGPGKIEVCHWIFENDLTWTVAD